MSLSAATITEIERLRDLYPRPRSAVLPSLWAVQHEKGYITPDGMEEVARVLGLAPTEVQAVSTFYSMYFDKAEGKHHAIVCENVSCALRGSDAIVAHIEKSLGVPSGETTKDGVITWERTVECLGACGGAPAMQVDHHFHENLTPAKVDEIFGELRGKPAPAEDVTSESTEAAAPKKVPAKRATRARKPKKEES